MGTIKLTVIAGGTYIEVDLKHAKNYLYNLI